jgi:4-diphosphocytidyl-2-C-methyl-D-erythritol kinase
LAGGSTNAAAVLKGMNQLFDLGLKEKELMERGLTLGADVPFCVQERTALATGIGEQLTPLPSLPSCYILLGKIPVEVSTKEIYQELDSLEVIEHPKTDRIIKALEQGSLKELGQYLGNVLELVTIPKFPLIQEIKDEMIKAGALGALMSGSGPTVFGLFEDKTLAEKAKEKIEKQGIANQVILVSTKDERREKNET